MGMDMQKKKINRDDFIATVGYDGATAVTSKAETSSLKNKTFDEILNSHNFRQAAACAIYDDDETEKQKVVDAYNKLSGGKYKVSSLEKLFGIGKPKLRKILPL